MKLRDRFRLLLMATSPWMAGLSADGSVIEFTDRAEWEAAVGRFTTIDFTGFPETTIITNQYEELGVTFTDGNDSILLGLTFPNDGAGLFSGFPDDIEVSLSTPQFWIAVEYRAVVHFELFNNGKSVYFSSVFSDILGNFAGLLSSEPFDAVVITNPPGSAVFIDDLHFGVPAPPAFALLAFGMLFAARRRRRHGCQATTSPR